MVSVIVDGVNMKKFIQYIIVTNIFINIGYASSKVTSQDLATLDLEGRLAFVSKVFNLEQQKELTYAEARNELPNLNANPSIYMDKQKKPSVAINCEHVVPQSRFKKKLPMRSDLHHLYPAYEPLNELRSNFKFVDIPDSDATFIYYMDKAKNEPVSAKVDAKDVVCEVNRYKAQFEPNGISKGNIARACAYFFTRYPQYLPVMDQVIDVETMIKWHESDPVDVAEQIRDARIFKIQSAHNPYVYGKKALMRWVWSNK